MADFVKRIDSSEGTLAFMFTKIYTVNGIIFHVSVFRHSILTVFHMEERDGSWTVVAKPKAPEWVSEFLDLLSSAIKEKLSHSQ
jgi:hypothetical protein